jgi:hypothetical protein
MESLFSADEAPQADLDFSADSGRRTVRLVVAATLIVGLVMAGFLGTRDSSVAVSSMAAPPPPPPSVAALPRGTYQIWPAENAGVVQGFRTPTDVAQDFAVQALDIGDPTVMEPADVSTAGIGSVTIALPTAQPLPVITERRVDGNWVIVQVGDQSRLRGITMLPAGKPGPVMEIFPPLDATSGDVIEVAADGTHRLHLTTDDLKTGVLHFPTVAAPSTAPSIYTVLIVYRNKTNQAVDALGGVFA